MFDWDARPVGVLQAINKITGVFNDSDAALLRLLADQAGVAIQRWNLQRQAVESSGLKHEMLLARRVQEAMIPRGRPDVSGLDGPVLVPGVGFQGGRPESLSGLGGAVSGQLLPAVSRDVLRAGPDVAAVRAAAERMRDAVAHLAR